MKARAARRALERRIARINEKRAARAAQPGSLADKPKPTPTGYPQRAEVLCRDRKYQVQADGSFRRMEELPDPEEYAEVRRAGGELEVKRA